MEHSASDERYCNLLNAVSHLYGKNKVSKSTRKEASLNVSEHDIPPEISKGSCLELSLCRSLPCKAKEQKMYSLSRGTKYTLAPFKDSVVAGRISRDLRFKKLKRTLNRWNNTIQIMRNEEQLIFPLSHGTYEDIGNISKFGNTMQSPVQKQNVNILKVNSSADKVSEHEEPYKTSLTELKELRKEKAKLNAQYSYMIAKAAKHKKIKSKKYHRMLKRGQTACSLDRIDELKNLNPLEAKELLESLERVRAKERVTLRHRSMGRWAQDVKAIAKQNAEGRKQLMEQLALNRELTQKPHILSSSDDETDEENNTVVEVTSNNPWIVDSVILEEGENVSVNEEHNKHQEYELLQEKDLRNKVIPKNALSELTKTKQLIKSFKKKPPKTSENLDPDAIIEVKPKILQLDGPSLHEESHSDDEEGPKSDMDTIAEAFSGDNVVAEFKEEREKISKMSRIENIDSSIPGWGKWSGKGAQSSARKQKQLTATCNKGPVTRHRTKEDIIFSEDKTEKLKGLQVNEVPLSFTKVKDYEASIRCPIGNTWAPQIAHQKFVSPPIITKLGSVIKPIKKDILLKK